MIYTQHTDCKEWQFKNIPEFTFGKMKPLFADCGTGLSRLPETQTKDNSFMHIFTETTAEAVKKYVHQLAENGYEKVFENSIDGNLFYQFAVAEGLLYVSFMKNSGVTRIILDRCRQTNASSFGYGDYDEKNSDTLLAQYSLYYDKMIKGTSCDCGMNYVCRLHDNSLIIIDGGEMEQSTEEAIADYLRFLHELTNTQQDEKLKISLWLCTHAHNDHCDFMSKLLRFHADKFTVERVAFNFPNPANIRHSKSLNALKNRLLDKFPEAEYIKLHAGSKFSIANAQLEVLLSAEDAVDTDPEHNFPGTNETSVVFKLTADGVSTLFLADCAWDNGDVLIENFDESIAEHPILQAAHHGINSIFYVYDRLNAEKVLLPQCRMNMETRFRDVNEYLNRRYGEENILLANDATYIFNMKDGEYTINTRAQVGGKYDKSEW